jgi:hypothetical protein
MLLIESQLQLLTTIQASRVRNEMSSFQGSRGETSDPQVKKNKQSMADLKLRRLNELNNRLREDLERDRIPVSQAAMR